jgi:pimeloyl-ACP methyl ester carboxylesterase
MATLDESSLTHRFATLRGVRLHYVEAGEGPLVVLLHGYPEHWYTWRHQIPALAAAGFRVLALDLRGYNLSEKPRGVAAYAIHELVADVASLIRVSGSARAAAVVGHDWGGGVAWAFAMRHPELLDRLAVLNCPHPDRLLRALRTRRQLAKSWYMLFFQIPFVPEMLQRRHDYAVLRQALRSHVHRPDALSDEDLARYVEAWAQPGALTASMNYYRAMFLPSSVRARELSRIEAPVLLIWGDEDSVLGPELAQPDPAWVPGARVEHVPGAGHFVQYDRPEEVNRLLLGFLGKSPAVAA